MLDRAARKKELIALGAMRRAELVVERESLRAAVQPQVLGRVAMQRVADAALGVASRKTGLPLAGIDVASVVPMVAAGISAFRKRGGQSEPGGVSRVLVRGGALVGLAAGVVAYLRRKQPRPEANSDEL